MCWDTCNGAPEAMCFYVDVSWISLSGVAVYVGTGGLSYVLELLVGSGNANSDEWQVLEKAVGIVASNEGHGDLAYVRFPKPVRLSESVEYCLKLCLVGSKTWFGEGGFQSVTGPRGAKFSFSSSPLSINGTTVARGQMPILLFSAEPSQASVSLKQAEARKWLMYCVKQYFLHLKLDGWRAETKDYHDRFFALLCLYIEGGPDNSLSLVRILDDLFPDLLARDCEELECDRREQSSATVSCTIESDHPYKAESVQSTTVTFPDDIRFVCIEFDEKCRTVSKDDIVTVYAKTNDGQFYIVAACSGDKHWPISITVPTKCIWALLETRCVRGNVDSDCLYGFKCRLAGTPLQHLSVFRQIEIECLFLLSRCSVVMCKEVHQLACAGSLSLTNAKQLEEDAHDLIGNHASLLRKGVRLGHQPTLSELIRQEEIPDISDTPERRFLREFIRGVPGSAAGKLARWLMPEPYIDPLNCEFLLECDHFQSGQPVVFTVITKDQYGRVAYVSHMSVDIVVLIQTTSNHGTAGTGVELKKVMLKTAFQPTYLNRARYTSITLMKQFEGHSFEELRFAFAQNSAVKESLGVTSHQDGSYVARWIGKQSGNYSIECTIDGFQLEKIHNINIHNGRIISKIAFRSATKFSKLKLATVRETGTAGVRIRGAPSLSGEQIGVVPRGKTIFFVEEVENNDGIWLKLNDESALAYCGSIASPTNTWCMQHSRHINRALLFREADHDRPVQFNSFLRSSSRSVVVACEELYIVTKCGYKGVEIKCQPYRGAKVVGMVSLGEEVKTIGWLQNSDGIWVQLHKGSIDRYGFETELLDGFCLIQEIGSGSTYLDRLVTPEASKSGSRQSTDNSRNLIASPSPDRECQLIELGLRQVATQTSPLKEKVRHQQRENPSRLKPTVKVLPQNSKRKAFVVQASSPSLVDCIRSAFAAVVWHDGVIHDAMACAAYLRFHPEMSCLQYRLPDAEASLFDSYEVPIALQLLHLLWKEVQAGIKAAIQQHIILPSPPMALRSFGSKTRQNDSTFCELCESWVSIPVTLHMRQTHSGCGDNSDGQGYNSLGKYTTGWTGNCGEGGANHSTWYLLCRKCRLDYLKATGSFKERQKRQRGRNFRQTSFNIDPQKIIKNNSMFLLDLNSHLPCLLDHVTNTDDIWTIDMFPQASPTKRKRLNDRKGQFEKPSYFSDPGPARGHLVSRQTSRQPSASDGSRAGHTSAEQLGKFSTFHLTSSPSKALKSTAILEQVTFNSTLRRPVIAFVVQHHDLDRIRQATRLSVVRAAAYTYSFKLLRWLIRLTTLPAGVEVILWHYLETWKTDGSRRTMQHPLRNTLLAGNCNENLLSSYHSLLKTVAKILSASSQEYPALHRLCLKMWNVEFSSYDLRLIVDCNLLSLVGAIMAENGSLQTDVGPKPEIRQLENFTRYVTMDVSTRSGLLACLTDGTVDTFWESGEEDKNRSKYISLHSNRHLQTGLVCLFIDNERDHMAKVSHVSIVSSDKLRKDRVTNCTVRPSFSGWLKFPCVSQSIRVELKGSEPTLRVRQVMVLGFAENEQVASLRPSPSSVMHFTAVQIDAFQLFETIVGSLFDPTHGTDEAGLRQQLLDFIFCTNHIATLQTHVVNHVTSNLCKEVASLRLSAKKNFSYCSGLLSILETIYRLTGASSFKAEPSFLSTAADLMLFSPEFIQSQLVGLLEVILPLILPHTLSPDHLISQLLMVIAKAITLQVRLKSRRHSAAPATPASVLSDNSNIWFLSKTTSKFTAHNVAKLVANCADGSYGAEWSVGSRNCLSELILASISYQPISRAPNVLLTLPSFWLLTAALVCVREHDWLLQSPTWKTVASNVQNCSVKLCDNHDDGHTHAQIWCSQCQVNLCLECCSTFHLNKRSRTHSITQLDVADSNIQIDLHEGCHRLRLSWILLLVDSSSLHGIVEVRDDRSAERRDPCRFCGRSTGSDLQDVCSDDACQSHNRTACIKTLDCGHKCGGIMREEACLPCLNCHNEPSLKQDGDDMCMICFTDTLRLAPSIQIACDHVFHFHCLSLSLSKRWPGPRISFAFMHCPICKAVISHQALADLLLPLQKLHNDVAAKALMRLNFEGLADCFQIVSQEGQYFRNPEAFALDRYAYYDCFKCNRAYYGGEVQCQLEVAASEYDPAELVCGACSDIAQAQICPRHGVEYLEYKCRYCCSIAVFFCFGTTHFCAACHDDFQRITLLPKHLLPHCPTGPRSVQMEGDECPLQISHPKTGDEFALGCGVCRNVQTF